MNVLYSCGTCRAEKEKVTVPERKPGESLESWMQKVGMAVALQHGIFGCPNKKVELMIPVGDEGAPLGTPKQNDKEKK
jgi:hypothetical protein